MRKSVFLITSKRTFLWIRRSDLPPEFREPTTPKSDDAAAGPTTANTFRGDFQQLIDKLEALEIPEDEHGCKDIATVMKTIKADYGSDSLTVLTSKSLTLKRDFGTPQSSRSSPAPTLKVHGSGSKVENEEPKAELIEKNSEDLTYLRRAHSGLLVDDFREMFNLDESPWKIAKAFANKSVNKYLDIDKVPSGQDEIQVKKAMSYWISLTESMDKVDGKDSQYKSREKRGEVVALLRWQIADRRKSRRREDSA